MRLDQGGEEEEESRGSEGSDEGLRGEEGKGRRKRREVQEGRECTGARVRARGWWGSYCNKALESLQNNSSFSPSTSSFSFKLSSLNARKSQLIITGKGSRSFLTNG